MVRYALVIFLFLSACNRKLEHKPQVSIDATFKEYVDEFVAESANQGHPVKITDLIVGFSSELADNTLGDCIDYNGEATNTIWINSERWKTENEIYRRVVLFHELGHCVLRRKHVTTGSIRGGYCTPTSIMYPDIYDTTNMYLENWQAYMVELFKGSSPESACEFNGVWDGI